MKIQFTLANVSGQQLVSLFAIAIAKDGVGFNETDRCSLSDNGQTWETATSKFSYRILNPQESEPAVVMYEGACRGFLKQELLPRELCGENLKAEATGGSALERFKQSVFEYPDARKLAKIYGLLQTAGTKLGFQPAFEKAVAAVEAASEIDQLIEEKRLKVDYASCAYAQPYSKSNNQLVFDTKGEPAVKVVCSPGGEFVSVEILVEEVNGSLKEYVVRRATRWINNILPCCRREVPQQEAEKGPVSEESWLPEWARG